MKKSVTIAFLAISTFSQVAINTDGNIANTSAILDVSSTSKGLLIPTMTSEQRTSIDSPANGLLVFDTDNKSFWFFDSSIVNWLQIKNSGNNATISDGDSDTYITTEQSSDEDTIRIYISGTEKWCFSGNTLEALNNGYSVFIGQNAGVNTSAPISRDVFIGAAAGMNNTTGDGNVAIGQGVFVHNTTGNFNMAIGMNAMYSNINGNNAKFIKSGFIAQEVEQVANELGYNFSGIDVPKNKSDNYGIRYAEFVVPLVKAVQELANQNNQLVDRINGQLLMIDSQKQSLEKLNASIMVLKKKIEILENPNQ